MRLLENSNTLKVLNVIKESNSIKESEDEYTGKELNDVANWVYNNANRDSEWDNFTDNELVELISFCCITDKNPSGRAYDDEVFDAADRRANGEELVKRGQDLARKNAGITESVESEGNQEAINKFKSIFRVEPTIRPDGAIVADGVRLRGTGLNKSVIATYTPHCLKVVNEEWGFFVYFGEVNEDSMENMSQYWFYDDYKNNEDFKKKVDNAAKTLYNCMENISNTTIKESVETFTDYKGNFDHDWFMNEVKLHIDNTYDVYKAACDKSRPAEAVANLAIQSAVNTCEPKPITWGQIKSRINKLGGDFEKVKADSIQAVEDFRKEMDEENALNESVGMDKTVKVVKEEISTENDDDLLWTSDYTAWVYDETDEAIMSEYRDQTGEEPEDADQAREYFINDDFGWDIDKEDWDLNFLPMIQEQTVNDIVILSGSVGLWHGNYDGGKVVDVNDLLQSMGDVDVVELHYDKKTNQLYMEGHHHDGTHIMYLYTIPKEQDKQLEFLNKLGVIDWLNSIYDYNENLTAEEDALQRLSSAKELNDVVDSFGDAIELATPIVRNW